MAHLSFFAVILLTLTNTLFVVVAKPYWNTKTGRGEAGLGILNSFGDLYKSASRYEGFDGQLNIKKLLQEVPFGDEGPNIEKLLARLAPKLDAFYSTFMSESYKTHFMDRKIRVAKNESDALENLMRYMAVTKSHLEDFNNHYNASKGATESDVQHKSIETWLKKNSVSAGRSKPVSHAEFLEYMEKTRNLLQLIINKVKEIVPSRKNGGATGEPVLGPRLSRSSSHLMPGESKDTPQKKSTSLTSLSGGLQDPLSPLGPLTMEIPEGLDNHDSPGVPATSSGNTKGGDVDAVFAEEEKPATENSQELTAPLSHDELHIAEVVASPLGEGVGSTQVSVPQKEDPVEVPPKLPQGSPDTVVPTVSSTETHSSGVTEAGAEVDGDSKEVSPTESNGEKASELEGKTSEQKVVAEASGSTETAMAEPSVVKTVGPDGATNNEEPSTKADVSADGKEPEQSPSTGSTLNEESSGNGNTELGVIALPYSETKNGQPEIESQQAEGGHTSTSNLDKERQDVSPPTTTLKEGEENGDGKAKHITEQSTVHESDKALAGKGHIEKERAPKKSPMEYINPSDASLSSKTITGLDKNKFTGGSPHPGARDASTLPPQKHGGRKVDVVPKEGLSREDATSSDSAHKTHDNKEKERKNNHSSFRSTDVDKDEGKSPKSSGYALPKMISLSILAIMCMS